MPYDETTSNNTSTLSNSYLPPKPGTVEPSSLRKLIQLFIQSRQRASSPSVPAQRQLGDISRQMYPPQSNFLPSGDGPTSSGGSGGNQYII